MHELTFNQLLFLISLRHISFFYKRKLLHCLVYLDIDGVSISSIPRCIEIVSGSVRFLSAKYSSVCRSLTVGFFHNFNNKLDPTTDTLLKAIAALAIHGANVKPIKLKAPAASGIPKKYKI